MDLRKRRRLPTRKQLPTQQQAGHYCTMRAVLPQPASILCCSSSRDSDQRVCTTAAQTRVQVVVGGNLACRCASPACDLRASLHPESPKPEVSVVLIQMPLVKTIWRLLHPRRPLTPKPLTAPPSHRPKAGKKAN